MYTSSYCLIKSVSPSLYCETGLVVSRCLLTFQRLGIKLLLVRIRSLVPTFTGSLVKDHQKLKSVYDLSMEFLYNTILNYVLNNNVLYKLYILYDCIKHPNDDGFPLKSGSFHGLSSQEVFPYLLEMYTFIGKCNIMGIYILQ